MTRRRMFAVAVAVLLLTAAGCSTDGSGFESANPPSVDYTQPPLPGGASPADTTRPLAPPIRCGDPTASLRPFPTMDPPPRGPTLDAIRARGRLIVGLDTGSNLFSFRDPFSGQIEGFDVDIAKEIAFDLLGNRNRIEYRILGSADREHALSEHRVDLVVKTMTISCLRRRTVSFSTVYYQANQRILTVKNSGISGLSDLAGKRVCVVSGTTSLFNIRRFQPAATILTVPDWADCLVELQQQQVDAVSTDDSILAGLAVQDPYTQVVGDSISPESYGVGISKGNDDLVRFVNGTLQRIRNDGTWNRIYDRWLSAVLGPSPGPPQPTYQD